MDAMEFLTSPLLHRVSGLTHGFGKRLPGTRAQAREAASRAFLEQGETYFLKQVHGCTVAGPPWSEPPDADASVSSEAGTLLAVETADCLPILIADGEAGRVAAAHAGWRGTASGVTRAAVRALLEKGSKPRNLVAALGPCIGPCCYEVGMDVEEAFGAAGSAYFAPGRDGGKYLDVAAANRAQLLEAGCRASNIEHLDFCTRCRPDLFFSYRRDGAYAGRMISVIGFRRGGD